MKYERFFRKKHNSNPRRCGPIHYKNPARIFWRAVRGMLPHKTFRGSIALAKLKCYEGVPSPYDKIKRMVVPYALRVLRKARGRSEVTLGILADSIGWKHLETIKKLEIKRDERAKILKPLK
jgi:large subunit ribosomal protein L13Ae